MRVLRWCLILCCFALLLTACQREGGGAAGNASAATVPDFTLQDLNGKQVTLSDYRGKIVVLNFWATWCPPCRNEMPSMERLNEVFATKDFVMLAVNVDDSEETLRAFIKDNPHSFTVMHDSGRKVQELYQVFKFPETFVIDKDGKLVDHIVGARDWSSAGALKYFGQLVEAR